MPAVGGVEDRLAAYGRDADAVPVVADPADGPVEWRSRRRAEAQGVEERDGSGAHRDDVAEDAADPGRRALEGLDGRRVVVALDLEGAREPVAEVDDAGVLARALEHGGPVRGESPQQPGRVLVAAMLGPEEREDAELEVVRVRSSRLRIRSNSPSVRPSARWSGCSATELKRGSHSIGRAGARGQASR